MKPVPALILILTTTACQQKAAPPAAKTAAQTSPATLPAGHPPIAATAAAPADAGPSLAGTVSASPAVAANLAASDALFLIARDAKSQQILAVRKEEGVRFPFRFTLSGADAMVPGTAFQGTLDLTARVSKSGDAMPAKGDVEGVTKGVRVGAQDVAITLDRVRP